MAAEGVDANSAGYKNLTGIYITWHTPLEIGIIGLSMLSSVFLAATVCIQVIFWKQNRNSKIMLSHMLSLTVYYSVGTARSFIDANNNGTLCYFFFATMYYSLSAAVIWMSVMSFDVWLFLSDMQHPMNIGGHRRNNLFLHYSIVAWGYALISLTVILVLNHDPHLQETLDLYPQIEVICWYITKRCKLVFSAVPMIVFSVFNFIFFVLTVVTIRKTRRCCQNTTNLNRSEEMFLIYVKLFVIIGVFFQEGLLVNAVLSVSNNIELSEIGYLIGCPQGIAIFMAYFCKRSTFDFLKRRLCTRR